MNFRFTVVETSLNRAEWRWKCYRFLDWSLGLGIVFSALALLLGGAMLLGWITTKSLALAFFVMLAVTALVAWVVVLISVAVADAERPWLASALERIDPRLLDRLNTLIALETHPPDAGAESFARRIARQTQKLLAQAPSPSPFHPARSLRFLLAFGLLLATTIWFYHTYSPWSRLANSAPQQLAQAPPDKPLELAPPDTNNLEQNQPWGEVRITDPGADLRVTKVDVVPIQIEAATNQKLENVSWLSTINGGDESLHALPPPSEPCYALYQPSFYLDELNLADWDVMTYYARARTEKQDSYGSEVYFLEVRPFREDILKMPGGENGRAYRALSELSALIGRQQHVIRQTHQYVQQPPGPENLQNQDRRKLADAESDLGDATQHLYARLAGEMENQPIGEALDNLGKATQSLGNAGRLLQTNAMTEAGNGERQALSDLVAARKMFQKAVSEHPKAFEEDSNEEPPPVAPSADAVGKIAEFRDEAKAAREFLKRMLDQQKALDQQARSAPRNEFSDLGSREQGLQKTIESFEAEHLQPFQPARAESDQAQEAMKQAANSLQSAGWSPSHPGSEARAAVRQATDQLQKFHDSLNTQLTARQLAQAYQLKQMLDRQTRTLDQRSKPGSTMSDQQLQQAIDAARQALDQLKQSAEQEPTRGAFGRPLRDELDDSHRAELDAVLQQLQQAQSEADKQQRAGEARDGLSKVSRAFARSQPKELQAARQNDPLKPVGQESLNVGLAELQSLLKELEQNRQVSPDDLGKQGREAAFYVQQGLKELSSDPSANSIALRLQEMAKGDFPLDAANLRQLIEQLQHFSVETADQLATKQDKPELTNIDPSRLPPAYRGRIQKYFQKLSEK